MAKKPFPHQEFLALTMLCASKRGMPALELQVLAGLAPGKRNMARALERLRAFGHVARELVREGRRGRPSFQYHVTSKGIARLQWLDANKRKFLQYKQLRP